MNPTSSAPKFSAPPVRSSTSPTSLSRQLRARAAPLHFKTTAVSASANPSRSLSRASNAGTSSDVVKRAEALLRSLKVDLSDDDEWEGTEQTTDSTDSTPATKSSLHALTPTSPEFVPAPVPEQDYVQRFGELGEEDLAFLRDIGGVQHPPSLDGLWQASSAQRKVVLKKPDASSSQPAPSKKLPPAESGPSVEPTSPPAEPSRAIAFLSLTSTQAPLPGSPAMACVLSSAFACEDVDSEGEVSTVPSNWSARSFEPIDDERDSESDSSDSSETDDRTTPKPLSPKTAHKPLANTQHAELEALVQSTQSTTNSSMNRIHLAEIPPFVDWRKNSTAAPEKPANPSSTGATDAKKTPTLQPTQTSHAHSYKLQVFSPGSHTASVTPHRTSVPPGASVYAAPTPAWTPYRDYNPYRPVAQTAPNQPWSPKISDAFLQSLYQQQQQQDPPPPAPNYGFSGPPPPGFLPVHYSSGPVPYSHQTSFGNTSHASSQSSSGQSPYQSQLPPPGPYAAMISFARPTHQRPDPSPKHLPQSALGPSSIMPMEPDAVTAGVAKENARLKKELKVLEDAIAAHEQSVEDAKLKISKLTEVEAANAQLRAEVTEKQRRVEHLEESVQRANQEKQDGVAQAQSTTTDIKEQAQKEIEALKSDVAAAGARTSAVVAEIVELEEKLRSEEESRAEGTLLIRRQNFQIAELQLALEDMKASAAAAAAAKPADDLLNRVTAFRQAKASSIGDDEIKRLQTERDSIRAEAKALEDRLDQSTTSQVELQKVRAELERKLSAADAIGAQGRSSQTSFERKIESLQLENQKLAGELKAQREETVTLQKTVNTSEALLDTMVTSAEEVETKCAKLEAALAAQGSTELARVQSELDRTKSTLSKLAKTYKQLASDFAQKSNENASVLSRFAGQGAEDSTSVDGGR